MKQKIETLLEKYKVELAVEEHKLESALKNEETAKLLYCTARINHIKSIINDLTKLLEEEK